MFWVGDAIGWRLSFRNWGSNPLGWQINARNAPMWARSSLSKVQVKVYDYHSRSLILELEPPADAEYGFDPEGTSGYGTADDDPDLWVRTGGPSSPWTRDLSTWVTTYGLFNSVSSDVLVDFALEFDGYDVSDVQTGFPEEGIVDHSHSLVYPTSGYLLSGCAFSGTPVPAYPNGAIIHTSETPHTGPSGSLRALWDPTSRLYNTLKSSGVGYHAITGIKSSGQSSAGDVTVNGDRISALLVDSDTARTYHAGYSNDGPYNGNQFIGLSMACLARNFDATIALPEYVSPGDVADVTFNATFRQKYIAAMAALLGQWNQAHATQIPKRHATSLSDLATNGGVIGHSEVDPGKSDPGFTSADWTALLAEVTW